MWAKLSLPLTLLALYLGTAEGSHFEGGTIFFSVQSGTTVRFDWSQGWRYNAGPCCGRCTSASINTLAQCSQGWWRCASGCSGNLAAVQYTVTALNSAENWEQGKNFFTHTFSGNGPFTVEYASCCWRSLSYGYGGSWSVRITFRLGTRSDTGSANSAPQTASAPIYRNQYGCGQTKTIIPMLDGDNDIVRCRWAAGSECAAVCSSLPCSSLASNGANCEVTSNTNSGCAVSSGWYAVAITLEDFPRTAITVGGAGYSTSSALSIVPLQFMIYTPAMSVSCGAVPIFVSPTAAANAQFSVLRGNTLSITCMAEDQSGYPVSAILANGPTGGTTSPTIGVTNNGGKKRSVIWTWSPSSGQSGGFNLCFLVSDGIGKSATRCMSVAVAVACPDPGTPSNMNRQSSTSAATFYYGDSVTYFCNNGYQYQSGNMLRTCQLNAAFDGSAPSCSIINCGSPPVGTGASKTSGTTYTFGGSTTFSCNSGYTFLSGSSSRSCGGSGSWSGSTYTCDRVNCGTPGTPSNGAKSGNDYKYGGTVTSTCNTGYYVSSGTASITCTASASWSGSIVGCTKVRCPNPGTILNSTRVMNPSASTYEYLDTVTYNPHTGYEIKSGSQSRTCQASATWSGTQPTIGRRNCPTLTRHNNATQTGTSYRYLDYVSWSCNTGYETSSGDSKVLCQSNRLWNGTVLQCRRITCSPAHTPHNNATQTGYAYRYLDDISWSCNTGYEQDTGNYKIQCLSNRAWNGTQLTCKRITCSTLTPHNNATQTGFAYRYLDVVSWGCHIGYERDTGVTSVTCQSNRQWSGVQLTCKRITCPTLSPHNNATQTGTSYRYLDYVSWSCNTGYERDSGDFKVMCRNNRAWNGSVLQCKRITCSPAYTPHNNATQTGYAYRYLDYISWNCHTGYEQDTGDFNVQCQSTRTWNGTGLACKRITCPTLTPHNNVTQTGFAYRYLDYVSWTLHLGYERASGHFNVQCQATRAWNGSVLAAKRVTCPTPLYVSNSTLQGTDYKYLGITTYLCDIGYEIKNGSETRACMPPPLNSCNTIGASCPGHWNGTLPVCGRKECFNMTNPANAHVVSSWYGININTRNFRFFYLDTIVWDCNVGFARKAGDWVNGCLSSAVWNGTSPTCKDIDECRSSPCLNNAICKNLVAKFQCLCVNGFSGAICQIPPTANPAMLSGSSAIQGQSNPFNLNNNHYQKSHAGHCMPSLLLLALAVLLGVVAR